MKILSVNIARVSDLFAGQADDRHRVKTGIHKRPVLGAVQVNQLGLEGDEQADQSVHGGLDKAVYAYPVEHYPFWNAQQASSLKRALETQSLMPGALGENLTVEGILEGHVWVGDRLCIGTVVLQVTEPRHPCFKLNGKLGFAHASKAMVQSGFSGFYLRVVKNGVLCAGDPIALLPGPREIAVSWLNERRRKGRQNELF